MPQKTQHITTPTMTAQNAPLFRILSRFAGIIFKAFTPPPVDYQVVTWNSSNAYAAYNTGKISFFLSFFVVKTLHRSYPRSKLQFIILNS